MRNRLSLPLSLISASILALSLTACGDDGGTADAADEVGDGDGDGTAGDGDGDPTTTGDGDGDGDPTTTGDGDGDPTTTGDGDGDPTTGDGDGDPGDCMVWEITYDLTDSEFEIVTQAGIGSQVNTVEEPYDDDKTVGPATSSSSFRTWAAIRAARRS